MFLQGALANQVERIMPLNSSDRWQKQLLQSHAGAWHLLGSSSEYIENNCSALQRINSCNKS